MKRAFMFMVLFAVILVGCSSQQKKEEESNQEQKPVVEQFSLKVEETKLSLSEIDTSAIMGVGEDFIANRFIDDKLYVDIRQGGCGFCTYLGEQVTYKMYDMTSKTFSDVTRNTANSTGIPFKNGLIQIEKFGDTGPGTTIIRYLDDLGLHTIEVPTIDTFPYIGIIYVGDDAIYLTLLHESFDELSPSKVIKIDETGTLLETYDVPADTDTVRTIWYLVQGVPTTFEIPVNCSVSRSDVNGLTQDQAIAICNENNQTVIKGFDFKTGTFFDFIPGFSDEQVIKVQRLNQQYLLIASGAKDSTELNPEPSRYGLFDVQSFRYIPINGDLDDLTKLLNLFNENSFYINVNRFSFESPIIYMYDNSVNQQILSLKIENDSIILTQQTYDKPTQNGFWFVLYENNQFFFSVKEVADDYQSSTSIIYEAK